MNWLAYYYKLSVFRDREKRLYNNVILQDGNNIMNSRESATRILKIMDRMIQAVTELLIRFKKLGYEQGLTYRLFYYFSAVLTIWKLWADFQYKDVQSIVSTGTTRPYSSAPETMKNLRKAESLEKKALEKLLIKLCDCGVAKSEIQELLDNANSSLLEDSWQPILNV
ncbi:hypothetical protein ACFLV5_06315 [Chloroflexota bacterium]